MIKVCTKCGIEKDESEFSKIKCGKNGLKSICKECTRNYHKEYYIDNKSNIKLQKEEYKKNNPDKIKEQNKQYYLKEKLKPDYKDKRNQYAKQYMPAYRKKRISEGSQFNLSHKMRSSFNSKIQRRNISNSKISFKNTGYKLIEYVNFFNKNYQTEFNEYLKNYNSYHIDHIIPCCEYDFNNAVDIIKCWNPENLRIIPSQENIIKGKKLDYDLIERYNIWHLLPDRLKYIEVNNG